MFKPFRPLLGKILLSSKKHHPFLSALAYKTILAYFAKEKNIDIGPMIVSVRFVNGVVYIHPKTPILRGEIALHTGEILEYIKKALEDIGVKVGEVKIVVK